MSVINTNQIDKFNNQLESITDTLDGYFADLQKQIDNSSNNVQNILDESCKDISDKITEQLAPIRQQIINIFKGQYTIIEEKISPILPLVNASVSLDTVVDIVTSIIAIITAPYQPYIQITTQLIPLVLELSSNIQKIVNYSPKINLPDGIVMPNLEIDIEPITAEDITG